MQIMPIMTTDPTQPAPRGDSSGVVPEGGETFHLMLLQQQGGDGLPGEGKDALLSLADGRPGRTTEPQPDPQSPEGAEVAAVAASSHLATPIWQPSPEPAAEHVATGSPSPPVGAGPVATDTIPRNAVREPLAPPPLNPPAQPPAEGQPTIAQAATGAPLPAHSVPPEGERTTAEKPLPLPRKGGILESRFADLLRPSPVPKGKAAAPPIPGLPTVSNASTGRTLALHAETVEIPPAAPPGHGMSGDALHSIAGQQGFAAAELPVVPGNPPGAAAPSSPPSVAPFPDSVPLGEGAILDQVIGRLNAGRPEGGSRLLIRLQPEELGQVEIDLQVEKDRVKAHLVAQSQQVQEVLEKHLPRLRDALEQQGLKLDQLQVSVDSQSQGGKGSFQQQAEKGGRYWRPIGHPQSLEVAESPLPAVQTYGRLSLRI